MRKIIISILIIGIISFIYAIAYFVGGISSVYPPIKKYKYSGTFNQLILGIRKYTSINRNVNFEITDTTGTKKDGYSIYMTIEIKSKNRDIVYKLKYENNDGCDEASEIEIGIVGVHDLINNIYGYRINDTGVKDLINYFSTDFLAKLKSEQNINLSPLWWY